MCSTCDKLRAEVRELREELEEWRMAEPAHESGDEALLAKRLKLWPQPARLVYDLMNSNNRIVSREFLTERLGYNGMGRDHPDGNTDEGKWLGVVLWKARRSLEANGVFDAIHTIRGRGYMMTKQKASEVRAVVGIEK